MISGNHHTFIVGDSNSGKTTLAKALMAASERCALFVNTQGEDVDGYQVEGRMPKMQELLGHRKVVWNDRRPGRMVAQLPELVERVFFLGAQLGSSSQNRQAPWLTFYVDEAWRFEGNSAPADMAPLSQLSTQGRRHGVIAVFMSQRAQPVSKTAVRLCLQTIALQLPPEDEEYIQSHAGCPFTPADRDWLLRPFHSLVHRRVAGESHAWQPHVPVSP